MQHLENVELIRPLINRALSVCLCNGSTVQIWISAVFWQNRGGQHSANDEVRILPSGKTSHVDRIVTLTAIWTWASQGNPSPDP